MTTRQWAIIAVLFAAIVIVFCFGGILIFATLTPSQTQVVVVEVTTTPIPVSSQPSIVQPTATLKPRPTDTPKPQVKLEVGSYTNYRNTLGSLTFAGEIFNKGDTPVTDITIAISLLDSSGNVLATGSYNSVQLGVASPQGKYPFRVGIDNAPKEWKDIKIQVQGNPLGDRPIFPPYLDLKVDKVTGQPPPSTWNFYGLTGRIVNVGRQPAKRAHIVAVAYDRNGKVIDVGDSYSKLDPIQAGADAPFQLEFGNIKDAPARYEIFVQGTSDAPTATPTPKVSPTPVPTLSVGAKRLEQYTLKLDDLPTGFSVEEEEEITPEQKAADSPDPAATLAEYRQQGRLFSLQFTFSKQASWGSILTGPTLIQNQVIEYRDATGAKRGYDLIVSTLQKSGWKVISASKLGDQSTAFQQNTTSGNLNAVMFTIVVQRRNMVSAVDVVGVSGGTSADDAYKLAVIAAKRLE